MYVKGNTLIIPFITRRVSHILLNTLYIELGINLSIATFSKSLSVQLFLYFTNLSYFVNTRLQVQFRYLYRPSSIRWTYVQSTISAVLEPRYLKVTMNIFCRIGLITSMCSTMKTFHTSLNELDELKLCVISLKSKTNRALKH